ncbi:MAG: lipopolysaccharide biosynthesis protein [Bacteriovoracia bacterium]
MSRVIGKAIWNSALLTASALLTSAMNFLTIFVFTRYFSQEDFGAYVSSQAKVALWLLLVDLGLYNGVISSLTLARNEHGENSGVVSAILRRSFSIRILGAFLGFVVVLVLAKSHATANGTFDATLFWRDIAFSPVLFGYACQQNITPYLAYRGQQGLSVVTQLATVAITAILGIILAMRGASVTAVLFTLSLSGLIASAWLYGAVFLGKPRGTKPEHISPWKMLFLNSWPYALIFATTTIWQRLDQIRAADLFGLTLGGEYGLAARLVGIPILMVSAVSMALFPDFQRTGVDAPEKLRLYISVMLKLLWRYGLFLALFILGGVSLVMVALFPKYDAALHLLPWFVPGIWAYGLFNFANNGLLGTRGFTGAVLSHLGGLAVYLLSLYFFPFWIGLEGVVLAYDFFCFSLFFFSYLALKKDVRWKGISLFGRFNAEEKLVVTQIREKILGRFR